MLLNAIVLIAVLFVGTLSVDSGQVGPPAGQADDPRLAKLPPALRDQGRRILTEPDEDTRADLAEGSAGKLRPIEPGPRSLFARSARGFAVLEADARTLTVTFVEADLTSPYTYTITRPE
jgi:hypothetical protein